MQEKAARWNSGVLFPDSLPTTERSWNSQGLEISKSHYPSGYL